MVAAVRVHKYGGPEVLTYEEVEVSAPGPTAWPITRRSGALRPSASCRRIAW